MVHQHRIEIVQSAVAGALGVLHGPAVFPVIQHRRLGLNPGAVQFFIQLLQNVSGFGHIAEYPGVPLSIVVHHRTVEFFKRAAAFAPLEILHRLGAVGHRLHGREQVHAGAF